MVRPIAQRNCVRVCPRSKWSQAAYLFYSGSTHFPVQLNWHHACSLLITTAVKGKNFMGWFNGCGNCVQNKHFGQYLHSRVFTFTNPP